MTTYTIVWHNLGHTELEVSATIALEVLADFYPNDDDPATPAEVLDELGSSSSIEWPGFSMWASPVTEHAKRAASVLSRIQKHQRANTRAIRSHKEI